MNKPEFLVRIGDEPCTCLGTQLIQILNLIHSFIKDYIWHGSDVEVDGIPFRLGLENVNSKKIGRFNDFMN